MTGLDPENMVILEIASIVTDTDLNIIAEGPNMAINHPSDAIDRMEDWSREHHTASGLLDRALHSEFDTEGAEKATLDFLKAYCNSGESPLCGNTIWQDRRFLLKYMPELESFFHYRLIDVSTIKELVTRWYPDFPLYEKSEAHLALSDIRESINELKYYREKFFSIDL